jgi:hypothetical protein
VSACGGGSSTASPATTPAGQQQNQSAQPGAGQQFPGATGEIAAVTGKTLQVQNPQTGQVAVTYTGATKITATVTAKASAVQVGSCVNVRSAGQQGSAASTTGPVTATSVQVSQPVDGRCGARAGGGGFGGATGTRPTDRPSGAPSGGPAGGQRGGGFGGARPVSGLVTALDGSTLTVASVTFGGGNGNSASAGSAPTPSTTPVQVTTTSATTYTRTVAGSGKDLVVGRCVTALGKADDTGAVAATSIASEPAVDGQCMSGFGGRRGGAAGAPAGGTS